MDIMPINYMVLCIIPEAIMIIYLGLYLVGVQPPLKKIIIAGVLQGIATYFIRRYTGYGMTLVLQATTFVLVTYLIVKVRLLCGLIANLVGLSIGVIVEAIYLLIALRISTYSFTEILSRDWMRIAFNIPRELILLSIILVCIRYKITLEEDLGFIGRINGQL